MLMLRDLLDKQVQKYAFFKDIFLCSSVVVYSAQSAVMDGTCFLWSLCIRTVSC